VEIADNGCDGNGKHGSTRKSQRTRTGQGRVIHGKAGSTAIGHAGDQSPLHEFQGRMIPDVFHLLLWPSAAIWQEIPD
jgi:hypothetical protein